MSDTDTLIFSTSNFDEPEPLANRRATILGITITVLILSWICVCTRLFTRLRVVRSAGWDDVFVVLYLIFNTSGAIAVCISPDYGLGKHLLLLDLDTVHNFLKLFYISNGSYVTATTFIKLSLLFQYLRIFERGTAIRRLCVVLIVVISLWGLAYAFMAWVPCFPVHDMWEQLTTNSKCYSFGSKKPSDLVVSFESHTAANMVFDVIVLAIPIPLYFEKDTMSKTKRGLVAILVMGCLVNVFAVWRLATVIQHRAGTFPVEDPTWYGPISIILAVLEINCASICASVPVFWPVLSKHFGQIFVTKEIEVRHEDRFDYEHTWSETELRSVPSLTSKELHYHDAFVMGRVDPLRMYDTAGVAQAKARLAGDDGMSWFKI